MIALVEGGLFMHPPVGFQGVATAGGVCHVNVNVVLKSFYKTLAHRNLCKLIYKHWNTLLILHTACVSR